MIFFLTKNKLVKNFSFAFVLNHLKLSLICHSEFSPFLILLYVSMLLVKKELVLFFMVNFNKQNYILITKVFVHLQVFVCKIS